MIYKPKVAKKNLLARPVKRFFRSLSPGGGFAERFGSLSLSAGESLQQMGRGRPGGAR
jgi:hypothetical protein